jgi:protoporphyrinogen IX oxidase
MLERLAVTYDWIKAAHLIFVIFWMAGLFALPRYLVYHQENLADAADAARWVERETKLRRIILTPAMIAVVVLGAALATLGGAWGQGWLHAKLLLVLGLGGYHGWAVGYAKKLARGAPTLSNRTLRALNEVPALGIALIVVLVIVKPSFG